MLVDISSVAAHFSAPAGIAYAASKFALGGLLETLAREIDVL